MTIFKLLGGYSQIIGGDISPIPPCFGTPGHKKELLSSLSSIKLVAIRNKCYQCKLVCTGTMNEWCKILTIKTLTDVNKT